MVQVGTRKYPNTIHYVVSGDKYSRCVTIADDLTNLEKYSMIITRVVGLQFQVWMSGVNGNSPTLQISERFANGRTSAMQRQVDHWFCPNLLLFEGTETQQNDAPVL